MIGFSGLPKTEWINDGRTMRLLEAFTFTDSAGKVWIAPKGSLLNGADIPCFFWRVAGSPYVGLHRRSSIIHDVYCRTRSEPSEAVHKMFYEGMLCDGMGKKMAWCKYQAVKNFGPEWEINKDEL